MQIPHLGTIELSYIKKVYYLMLDNQFLLSLRPTSIANINYKIILMYVIDPDRNKPWNGLPLLPPEEEYYRTLPIMERLIGARIALAKLKEQSDSLPNPGIMVTTITLQEARQSSAIENVFTTDDELYKVFSESIEIREGPTKEIINYRKAIFEGFNYLKDQGLNKNVIVDLYRMIKNESDGIREHEIWITGINEVTKERVRVYTPPSGKFILEEKLDNLIDFITNDDKYKVDPVLKMIVGHAQFEAIHPFKDGNGRTGRILNVLILTMKEVLSDPILYLSGYINRTKDDYYYHLGNVTKNGNWQAWINYMLKAVQDTAYVTYDKIASIHSSMKEAQNTLAETNFKKQHQLIEKIYTQPFTTVKHLTKSNDNPDGLYSENTSRNYLAELTKIGMLQKVNIGGNHYFKNVQLTNILQQ